MELQLSKGIIDFLNSSSTISFLTAANNFVSLLEVTEIDNKDFIKRSHTALIDLYATGHHFEEIELNYSGAESDFENDVQFEDKNANIVANIELNAFYWEIFDPSDGTDKEASMGWLVDDYAGIYHDLKRELEKIKLNRDDAVEDALWQLKFSFRNHWGNHCINALRFFHYYWYDNK